MVEYWYLPDANGNRVPYNSPLLSWMAFFEQEELWFSLNKAVNHWREQIGGVSEDGWISNEKYEDTVRKVAELKASLIAGAQGDEEDIWFLERRWLFRDRDVASNV